MNLKELKEPYEKNYRKELEQYTDSELVGMYLSTNSSNEKTFLLSTLICHAWPILQRIYNKNRDNLSEEDCYDIFIQTLHYVVESHVWDNEKSSLYGDEQAFMKAMAIAMESRRKNFLKAQFRDKRILNVGSLSLDGLEEDFSDGYFSYEPPQERVSRTDSIIEERIKYYAKHGLYMTALILEGILYCNVYDDKDDFDLRKLRKYLRNLSDEFKEYFAKKYAVELIEFMNMTQYAEMPFEKLDAKIRLSFTTLKHDAIIKRVLDK